MTSMQDLLKTAYALGVRQALLDVGYDEKTAENMMENVTKEMTPTAPSQFQPEKTIGDKPTETVKESMARVVAKKVVRKVKPAGPLKKGGGGSVATQGAKSYKDKYYDPSTGMVPRDQSGKVGVKYQDLSASVRKKIESTQQRLQSQRQPVMRKVVKK